MSQIKLSIFYDGKRSDLRRPSEVLRESSMIVKMARTQRDHYAASSPSAFPLRLGWIIYLDDTRITLNQCAGQGTDGPRQ